MGKKTSNNNNNNNKNCNSVDEEKLIVKQRFEGEEWKTSLTNPKNMQCILYVE